MFICTFAIIMNDFTAELAKLHQLSGAEFSRQVERIALRKEFHPLDSDSEIFSVGGERCISYIRFENDIWEIVCWG